MEDGCTVGAQQLYATIASDQDVVTAVVLEGSSANRHTIWAEEEGTLSGDVTDGYMSRCHTPNAIWVVIRIRMPWPSISSTLLAEGQQY